MPPIDDDLEAILPEDLESSIRAASSEVKVYKRRWWMLFIFAGMGFMQCAVWNTWGPITSSVKLAYPSWTDASIALLSMWGTITMIFGLIPLTALLQIKGIRVAILVTGMFFSVGTAIRCFSTDEEVFTYLAHMGAILNGFSGIVIGAAPSLLSSRWFPPNERTTATGIGCTFNQLGNAGGFFFGPWLVRIPKNHSHNDSSSSLEDISDEDVDELRRNINDYMWITAGLCISLFLGALAYFPDRPNKPPSVSSSLRSHQDVSLKEEVKTLLRNKNLLLLVLPYSLTLGVNVAWSSVLDINVAAFGITQDEASWMGVYVTFGGVAMAIIAARFSDLLFGYMKLTIIVLMVIASAGYTWFLLLMNQCLPFSKVQLFISVIIGASFNYACSPLFFELAVELAYPVSEGVVGGLMTMSWNIVAAIFLLTMQTPMTSVIWMDYVLAIQGLVVVLLMGFVKEEYRRTSLDKASESQTPQIQEQE